MRTEWSCGEISRCRRRIRDAHSSSNAHTLLLTLLCAAPRGGSLSDHSRLTSVLTVAYMRSKSRTERPGMSKIGAEEEHVTCSVMPRTDSATAASATPLSGLLRQILVSLNRSRRL